MLSAIIKYKKAIFARYNESYTKTNEFYQIN